MPVANHPSTAIRKDEFGGRGQKRLEFRFNRLRDQPTRAGTQNFGERIVDIAFLSEGNNSILVHGVTLLREVRVASAPTPLRRLPHPVTQFPP